MHVCNICSYHVQPFRRKKPSDVQIKMTFDIDANGILNVSEKARKRTTPCSSFMLPGTFSNHRLRALSLRPSGRQGGQKARAAIDQVLQRSCHAGVVEDQLRFIALDVSLMKSVRRFADEFSATNLPLHTLILNVGVMLHARALSEDGLEMTLASNHFGHFLPSRLLLPKLREADARGEQPRTVVVDSNLCYWDAALDFSEAVQVKDEKQRQAFLKKPCTMFRAYAQSKLANQFFHG